MPDYSSNLNLYKYNTITDGDATFNIDNALNNNWDTVDTAIKANQDNIATKASTTYVDSQLSAKLDNDGGTIAGNLTIDNGTNTNLVVKADDTGAATISAYGDSQGTGIVYVGQDSQSGGGISFNGDGSPTFCDNERVDYVTFFRRYGGTNVAVFDYKHGIGIVDFKNVPTVNFTPISLSTHTHSDILDRVTDNETDISALQNTSIALEADVDTLDTDKQNKLVKTTHTIDKSTFTLANDIYSVDITDTNATVNTFVSLLFSSSDILNKVVSGISTVESNAGYVTLKMLKLPTDDITITLIFSEVS